MWNNFEVSMTIVTIVAAIRGQCGGGSEGQCGGGGGGQGGDTDEGSLATVSVLGGKSVKFFTKMIKTIVMIVP